MGPSSLSMTREVSAARWMALAAAVAVCVYAPMLGIPLISDTYLQIGMARELDGASAWKSLAADVLYRCRATSLVFTWLLDKAVGADPFWLRFSQVMLHILNAFLVLLLGRWRRVGFGISAPAAVFFAVHEGHQEAVVWFAALPETLVFTFTLISLLAWMEWVGRPSWTAATVCAASFVLALLSKESAVVLPALMLGVAWIERMPARRWMPWVGAFGVLALLYAAAIFLEKKTHLHLNDGTFSLHAPFPLILANSTARMFWFWGVLAVAAGALLDWRRFRGILAAALVWCGITFLPYSFLLYMNRVPSRHTYLPSLGLAIAVGAALWLIAARVGRRGSWVLAVLLMLIVGHNAGYLWVKKIGQYERRAEPTEALLRFAAAHPGPIHVDCFPYGADVAVHGVAVVTGRDRDQVTVSPQLPLPGAARFCYSGPRP